MQFIVAEFIERLERMQQTGDESNLEDGMNALARFIEAKKDHLPEKDLSELTRIGAVMMRGILREKK